MPPVFRGDERYLTWINRSLYHRAHSCSASTTCPLPPRCSAWIALHHSALRREYTGLGLIAAVYRLVRYCRSPNSTERCSSPNPCIPPAIVCFCTLSSMNSAPVRTGSRAIS